MKKFLVLTAFLFSAGISSLEACPYSAMTKIDEKLDTSNYLNSDQLAKIKELRKEGEVALRLGQVEKSEEILNSALALFK